MSVRSKLTLRGSRVDLRAPEITTTLAAIFTRLGCASEPAHQVAEHLVDTSLCGMESHGVMRTLQYAEQFKTGYIDPKAIPQVLTNERDTQEVDGGSGIGIPAMHLAYQHGMQIAQASGISALAIRNVGHTGRHGAFADIAADKGFLTICMGGGNRKKWRQVAPYGGAKGMLPTNPWCIGIPGGGRGPVILDFATSKIAGGWIYAAQSAGALLPEGCVIDAKGSPTRDPQDYFNGGAILPAGGHKGYALALVAELIGEAMLGPSTTEGNWLLITLDTHRMRESSALSHAAEEVLEELRCCPPAPGYESVEIPGEREREYREKSAGIVSIPRETWDQIMDLHDSLNSSS